jgi:hypothetical protein
VLVLIGGSDVTELAECGLGQSLLSRRSIH